MTDDEYGAQASEEVERLLGAAQANASIDLWGEVFLALFFEQSYLRGISVASCAHTWALSMPIYE